jgi:hypothetical protein
MTILSTTTHKNPSPSKSNPQKLTHPLWRLLGFSHPHKPLLLPVVARLGDYIDPFLAGLIIKPNEKEKQHKIGAN